MKLKIIDGGRDKLEKATFDAFIDGDVKVFAKKFSQLSKNSRIKGDLQAIPTLKTSLLE